MKTKLTESQRYLVSTSLRVAAEKYDENASYLISAGIHGDGNIEVNARLLAEQFNLQAREARGLAQQIEDADVIEVQS